MDALQSCVTAVSSVASNHCSQEYDLMKSCLDKNQRSWVQCEALKRGLDLCLVKHKAGELVWCMDGLVDWLFHETMERGERGEKEGQRNCSGGIGSRKFQRRTWDIGEGWIKLGCWVSGGFGDGILYNVLFHSKLAKLQQVAHPESIVALRVVVQREKN